MSLEENPTFLILYLNVNLEQHLVVVHHDDFDQKMVHIPVQVDHFVEEIQALQRPLREAFKKKTVKLGENSQQGGVRPDLNFSQPLNKFKKNKKYSECPETHKKHIKHFSIFRGDRSDT